MLRNSVLVISFNLAQNHNQTPFTSCQLVFGQTSQAQVAAVAKPSEGKVMPSQHPRVPVVFEQIQGCHLFQRRLTAAPQ